MPSDQLEDESRRRMILALGGEKNNVKLWNVVKYEVLMLQMY